MKRYIRIPEDTPVISADDDKPVTKGQYVSARIAKKELPESALEELNADEAATFMTAKFEVYIRTLTNHILHSTKVYPEMLDLRDKLTKPVGTVVEIEDEEMAYRDLIALTKCPQEAYAKEFVLSCLLTYRPYAKVLWNAPTEKPAES